MNPGSFEYQSNTLPTELSLLDPVKTLFIISGKPPQPRKDEIDAFLDDEIDALPPKLRYSNFDFLCTIISILTYLFDLVTFLIVYFVTLSQAKTLSIFKF